MIELSLIVVLLCASCTSGVSPTYFEFERGSKGIVECPAMVDNGYSSDDIEAIYWYFVPKGSSDSAHGIISYFHGETTHQISNHEQYNIQNTSLVISNVTYSTEGKYSYRYIPWIKASKDGSVEVCESVSTKAERPKVTQCSQDQPSCEIKVPHDTTYLNLTCSVEHAKPAVDISWFGWFPNLNRWEKIHVTPQFEFAPCDASETDCFYVIHTYNSNATVKISLESNNSTFKCVANNSKLENITVNVIKTQSDIVTAKEKGVTTSTRFGLVEPASLSTGSERLNPWIILLIVTNILPTGLIVLIVLLLTVLRKRMRRRYVNKKRQNHHVCTAHAQETANLNGI